ncbi:MAG: DUF5685 family protein [Lachnospiraceae bacterium]|nr:DUF5685 family protein [Lachnospiraceae bacterium]MEE3462256.1 DUF5685 family protein [Lachnospiraceae bacterium]
MFGYVTVDVDELKVKEMKVYRSFYCGLCHRLTSKYSPAASLLVNYDLTFLCILLSGLYDNKTRVDKKRCLVHPAVKRPVRQNEFTDYAADMTIILMYQKLLDDAHDDRSLVKGAGAFALKKAYRKAKKAHPECSERIECDLKRLYRLENRNGHIRELADLFGDITGILFRSGGEWDDETYELGFHLGRYIYITDAYDDIFKDMKKGEFNPLKPVWKEDRSPYGGSGENVHVGDEPGGSGKKMRAGDELERYGKNLHAGGMPDGSGENVHAGGMPDGSGEKPHARDDLERSPYMKDGGAFRKHIRTMAFNEMKQAYDIFDILPIEDHREIIRNILFDGVIRRYDAIELGKKPRPLKRL